MEFSTRKVYLIMSLLILSDIRYAVCASEATSTTITPQVLYCDEQAKILTIQEERYDEFRVFQDAILDKLDEIESKLELSLTPTNNRNNCTTEAEEIISHLGNLNTLIQGLGRNVESITGEPTSCAEVHAKRRRFGLPLVSGVYAIFVRGALVRAYCDLTTDGGGWTVFQKRRDSDTDFFRSWQDYKEGFGNPGLNYWLGNDIIHLMTREVAGVQSLRVDIIDWQDKEHYIMYSKFSIGDEDARYVLSVGPVAKGNMSEALFKMHHGKKFSTKDKFVNYGPCIDCPNYCAGAWWYGCCFYSNLNGKLLRPGAHAENNPKIAKWYDTKTHSYIFAKRTEMKFRPVDFDGSA